MLICIKQDNLIQIDDRLLINTYLNEIPKTELFLVKYIFLCSYMRCMSINSVLASSLIFYCL